MISSTQSLLAYNHSHNIMLSLSKHCQLYMQQPGVTLIPAVLSSVCDVKRLIPYSGLFSKRIYFQIFRLASSLRKLIPPKYN